MPPLKDTHHKNISVFKLIGKEVIDMMVTLFDEEKIMKAHDKTILEQGVVDGIVKMCKRYKGTIQEAIEQVMEELNYDKETATEAVKKYW